MDESPKLLAKAAESKDRDRRLQAGLSDPALGRTDSIGTSRMRVM